jgi:hypothetical protein
MPWAHPAGRVARFGAIATESPVEDRGLYLGLARVGPLAAQPLTEQVLTELEQLEPIGISIP